MFHAVYRRIKRFLAWLNGEGSAVKQAENHRRDVESRYGGYAGRDSSYGDFGDWGS